MSFYRARSVWGLHIAFREQAAADPCLARVHFNSERNLLQPDDATVDDDVRETERGHEIGGNKSHFFSNLGYVPSRLEADVWFKILWKLRNL